MELRYRLLNVFAIDGDRFSGNPLCVFEDGRDLSTEQMQALARQMNLSETTFILPPETAGATARVRIFTPSFEMPFAGHPTLGTAHVVRTRSDAGNCVVLEMKVGLVEVVCEPGDSGRADRYTLRTARPVETRPPVAVRAAIAAMLGLRPDAVADTPLWIDTGAEQLVVPLASAADVEVARPNAALLAQHGFSDKRGAAMAYVWAPNAPTSDDEVVARFFFLSDGSVVEDPATGSACANLGGWLIAMRKKLPLSRRVHQGAAIARPSILDLRVDEERRIFVGGAVLEVGAGVFRL